MARPKTDRLLVAVGALAGAALGLTAALVNETNGPYYFNPIRYSLTYRHPPQPGTDAVFRVEILGAHWYTRTAPTSEAFDAERTLIRLTFPAVLVGLGAVCGGAGVVLVSRWLMRSGEPVS